MKNIEVEMILFFAKEVLLSLRQNKPIYLFIFEIGKPRFKDVMEFLIENNEISEEEKNELLNINNIFNFIKKDIQLMESMKIEIQEGKTHWENLNIELLEKMIHLNLINEKDAIRYLAHRNHYNQVIAWSESKRELFEIAKKYGSERTQIKFKNYETMKSLENKLLIKNSLKEKLIKI